MLVADDNPLVREVVRLYLEKDGLSVVEAADGAAASAELLLEHEGCSAPVDLAVLDVLMPGRSGIDICRMVRMRADLPDIPIILISDLGDEPDRVRGLAAGADDYLAKPFSARELALRVGAILRRARRGAGQTEPWVRDVGVAVSTESRTALCDGIPVELTGREFDLLAFLMRHPRRVFAREELLAQVWGWDIGDLSTVTVHIKRVRAKLGEHHRISTVWGRGYAWGRSDIGRGEAAGQG
ncbi:response regulator transcription factor [Nocardia terrae]|uniref:response regulator transcription factor n=1 Tax=Nocardia terrae TaxID=2675851 RepID=UPI002E2523E9